jgi:hypothetical protein
MRACCVVGDIASVEAEVVCSGKAAAEELAASPKVVAERDVTNVAVAVTALLEPDIAVDVGAIAPCKLSQTQSFPHPTSLQ